MALQKPVGPVATDMPAIKLILADRLATEEEPASQAADYQLAVTDQNGRRYRFPHEQGNALPHLTTDEKAWLMQFMTDFRARCESEVLT